MDSFFNEVLGMRECMILVKMGFKNIEDIKEISLKQLKSIKGVGIDSINKIIRFCESKDIKILEDL